MSVLKNIVNSKWSYISVLATIVISGAIGCKPDGTPVPDYLIDSDPGEELLGGKTTVYINSVNAFSLSVPGLDDAGDASFVVGNSFFRTNWVAAPASTTAVDGLGPMLNARSCSGCHNLDGRGAPPESGGLFNSMLMRLSTLGTDEHGAPNPHPQYGDQLSNRAIQDVHPEGDVKVTYTDVEGAYPDGSRYSLRKPVYEFINLNYGSLAGVLTSPRVAPQMPGLGLLEAIPASTILANADPDDADGDGISGRPNYVWDFTTNSKTLGRFGWKANQPNLLQQVASAFIGDMGLTSYLFPDENLTPAQAAMYGSLPNGGSPEVPDRTINNVTFYSATLAVPARRNWKDATVRKGKALFSKIGCDKCHTPIFTTGDYYINQLAQQKIRPYTDLLLHDMGAELADGRPDFEATGQEWRTPPLWGIGLIETVSGHTTLLHDGRARNMEEAILWHSGEAEQVREKFKQLPKPDRDALILFLKDL